MVRYWVVRMTCELEEDDDLDDKFKNTLKIHNKNQ